MNSLYASEPSLVGCVGSGSCQVGIPLLVPINLLEMPETITELEAAVRALRLAEAGSLGSLGRSGEVGGKGPVLRCLGFICIGFFTCFMF